MSNEPTAADYANSAASDAKTQAATARREVADLRRQLGAPPPNTYSSHADIENRFSFHPATTPERIAQHEAVRDACKRLAHALDRIVPNGRPKALALTAVEEAMHWANAAVACQPPPSE